MNDSMFMKILYQKRWLLFWWFIAFVGTAMSTVIFFPAFKGTNIGAVFNSLPASVQHIAGTASSFNTIGGYISQEVFGLRAPLLALVLGIVIFNSLSVGEERKGILETHVTLPLSRSKIYFSKLFAAILIIVIASTGLFVGTELALLIIHYSYSTTKILELVANSAILGIVFGLVLYFFNSIFGIRGIVLGLSCAYAFISYLLTSFAISEKKLRTLDKGSLFHYYNSSGSFSTHNFLTITYIGIVLIIIGFFFFRRRDIET